MKEWILWVIGLAVAFFKAYVFPHPLFPIAVTGIPIALGRG